VVEPGDHLWKISETEVARRLGRSARPDEVAPYWLSVIDANRDSLHSGDPDLIYPGESITLPAPGLDGG
jgi:nucleoid-associated protein YgaU